jgi:hypothetical protein
MRSQIIGLRVASVIFGLIALAQLARFVIGGRVIVGGHALPLWPSALAFFIFGGLSIWLWSLSRQNFVRQVASGLMKKL